VDSSRSKRRIPTAEYESAETVALIQGAQCFGAFHRRVRSRVQIAPRYQRVGGRVAKGNRNAVDESLRGFESSPRMAQLLRESDRAFSKRLWRGAEIAPSQRGAGQTSCVTRAAQKYS
jgi:hypothetical protein